MKTSIISLTRLLRVPLVTFALGAGLATGFAQTPPSDPYERERERTREPATPGTQLERNDRNFITKAAKLGAEEVHLSRMAAERASNPEIKSYAQQLASEHERANRELTELATRKGVTLSDRSKDYDRWMKKDTEDFDEDYVKRMRSTHKDAVDLFEEAARDSKDAEVAAYARKYLPKMQEHLSHIERLETMLK